MPTIAQIKRQVDRIWVASFQTDLADTLAAHLRRYALAGGKPPSKPPYSKNWNGTGSVRARRTPASCSSAPARTPVAC